MAEEEKFAVELSASGVAKALCKRTHKSRTHALTRSPGAVGLWQVVGDISELNSTYLFNGQPYRQDAEITGFLHTMNINSVQPVYSLSNSAISAASLLLTFKSSSRFEFYVRSTKKGELADLVVSIVCRREWTISVLPPTLYLLGPEGRTEV